MFSTMRMAPAADRAGDVAGQEGGHDQRLRATRGWRAPPPARARAAAPRPAPRAGAGCGRHGLGGLAARLRTPRQAVEVVAPGGLDGGPVAAGMLEQVERELVVRTEVVGECVHERVGLVFGHDEPVYRRPRNPSKAEALPGASQPIGIDGTNSLRLTLLTIGTASGGGMGITERREREREEVRRKILDAARELFTTRGLRARHHAADRGGHRVLPHHHLQPLRGQGRPRRRPLPGGLRALLARVRRAAAARRSRGARSASSAGPTRLRPRRTRTTTASCS